MTHDPISYDANEPGFYDAMAVTLVGCIIVFFGLLLISAAVALVIYATLAFLIILAGIGAFLGVSWLVYKMGLE